MRQPVSNLVSSLLVVGLVDPRRHRYRWRRGRAADEPLGRGGVGRVEDGSLTLNRAGERCVEKAPKVAAAGDTRRRSVPPVCLH